VTVSPVFPAVNAKSRPSAENGLCVFMFRIIDGPVPPGRASRM